MKFYRIAIFLFVVLSISIFPLQKPQGAKKPASQRKKITIKDKALKNFTTRGDWQVWGTVYNQNKQGQPGLTVELWDKDLMFDDLLGSAKTGHSGRFTIRYEERNFKELTEDKPDLYVVVRDKNRKSLFSSKKQPRYGAGKSERFTIVLKTKLFLKSKILKVKK